MFPFTGGHFSYANIYSNLDVFKDWCMKNLNTLWGSLIVSGIFTCAMAAPFNPTPRTIDNGSDSVTIQKLGDEHYNFTRTIDGYLLEQDSNGVYYYVNSKGERSNVKAKNADARSATDKAFLRSLNKSNVLDAHQKKHPDRLKRKERNTRPDWVPVASESSESVSESSASGVPVVRPLPNAKVHTKGDIKFPVILIAGSGSQASTDSSALYKALNQDNYTAGGHTGSVRDYFNDQSSGVFKPSFDLYYVTVSKSLSSYVGNEDQLVKEAISAMRSKYSNFDASKYDSNNDGIVDATGFLYAGAVSGSNGTELGGFQYELGWNNVGQQDAGNGKKFNSYFIISDQSYFPVFVHEFSHTMGLMDHYCVRASDCYDDFASSSYQAPGAHYWDVMATGMYANGGLTPPSYSGFERAFMGWMNYTTLTASSAVTTITPLNTTNKAYKISVSGDNDEWWVLENRQKTKWDAALPNHGMLIWHIDYDQTAWEGDALNDDKTHQRIDVVEAGNLRVTGYYDGFKTTHFMDDPFPGSQNVTSYGPFTSWAGKSQGIQLYSITEKNSNVCFATQSGVSVGDCSSTVSSSSSSVKASSSSIATSSSSSRNDISSSSVKVSSSSISSSSAKSSSSSVQLVTQTINLSTQLTISDSYESVSLDLSSVATALGISAANASSLYQSGALTYSAVTSAGVLDNTPSTAEEPGHWFDAQGNVISWGEGAAFYSNLNLSSMTAAIGNYPNGVTAGTYNIAQALTYNGKQVIFKIQITAVSSVSQVVVSSSSNVAVSSSSVAIVSNSSANVVSSSSEFAVSSSSIGTAVTAVESNFRTQMNLDHRTLHVTARGSAVKTVALFDMLGNKMSSAQFAGENYSLDLAPFAGKVLVVRLTEGSKVLNQRKISVK